MKEFNKKLLTEQDIFVIKEEVENLKRLDHPNIPKYYETFEDKQSLFVVSDFIKGYSLAQYIENMDETTDEELISRWILQLLSVLSYCHSMNVLHRNIKPSNIIISNDSKSSF